jgi:hypothetical protein
MYTTKGNMNGVDAVGRSMEYSAKQFGPLYAVQIVIMFRLVHAKN